MLTDQLPLEAGEARSGFRARSAPPESEQDKRLVRRAVARAKEGDRDALRFLYVRYADSVYGYVRSIVRDDFEAEDITQHVFAKLMTVIVKYDQRSVPFLGWLLRLAHNAAIDHLRSRRAVPAEEIFGADTRADDNAAERTATLQEALATLPADQRNVVVMRHLCGLTPGEIAVQIGRSESSVHGLHHRGRRALQAELQRLDSAPSIAGALTFA
ncbi:MAG TPA: sigma-70 family RNA polymerase sigma factor [Solirubrobacteraceae bacterium]